MNYKEIQPGWLQTIIIILALIIIPLVNEKKSIDRDYVQIAVSILKESSSDTELKKWATEIVDKKAPVKLTEKLYNGLGSGQLVFPTSTISFLNSDSVIENFIPGSNQVNIKGPSR